MKGKYMSILKIMKKNNKAILPKRATEGSAGFDMFSCIESDIIIKPGKIVKIPTGVAIELEDVNYVGLIYARSGLAINKGITLANGVGVIDSDYRGEISIGLYNTSNEIYIIKPFEKIAQLVVTPICIPEIKEVKFLTETQRDEKGFGSTGRL
jgi:dUTP pyrophosphatase